MRESSFTATRKSNNKEIEIEQNQVGITRTAERKLGKILRL